MSETLQHTLTGDIRTYQGFRSRYLRNERDVLIYLPPDYQKEPERRYPVLYLHDGQNLFDGATAYVPGQEWSVDETAEALIRAKEIEPLIIVGVNNARDHRIDEYTPTRDQNRKRGGRAQLYSEMLLHEIKPRIDMDFRTLSGPENTGVGGSSLGGLLTLVIGMRLPHQFGKIAAMSPALWWGDRYIVRQAQELKEKFPSQIWLDMGTEESEECLRDSRALYEALTAKGWQEGSDLHYQEVSGAGHNEAAWAARIGNVLKFLFPVR